MKLPNGKRYHRQNDIRKLFGYPTVEEEPENESQK